jgi:hypothetical protein
MENSLAHPMYKNISEIVCGSPSYSEGNVFYVIWLSSNAIGVEKLGEKPVRWIGRRFDYDPSGMEQFVKLLTAANPNANITRTNNNFPKFMREDTAEFLYDTCDAPVYAHKIKQKLAELKMSQSDFARLCGCSPTLISKMVRTNSTGVIGSGIPKYIWECSKNTLRIGWTMENTTMNKSDF